MNHSEQIDLVWRDQVDAVTAGEELIERITVVRAIAMISLPLPRQVEPCRDDRREAA